MELKVPAQLMEDAEWIVGIQNQNEIVVPLYATRA